MISATTFAHGTVRQADGEREPMTDEEISRARFKLYHFFPELSKRYYSSIEYCSFRVFKNVKNHFVKKKIIFFVENVPSHCIKCIAMDFTNDVSFNMQIYFFQHVTRRNLFTDTNGAHSNYFFSHQPGIHTKWGAQSRFFRDPDDMMMHAEIDHLKKNGMGLFFFEAEDLKKCEKSAKLEIALSFGTDENLPERFTIYILR